MATPKNPSSPNGVLWVIAFALAVIAACLVVMVMRQEDRTKDETVEAPGIERVAGKSVADRNVPHSLSFAPRTKKSESQSPAPAPPPEEKAVFTAEVPVVQAAAKGPIVVGGLAPLTELAVSNYMTVITGRVTLDGTPPPENPIPFDSNPQCGPLHQAPATTHRYIVSSDGELANVFVFIKTGLEGKRFPPPGEPVVINQKGCFYEPYVAGLMVNQTLRVRNSDPFLHNVHVTSPDGVGDFNLAETFGGVVEKRFRHPEIPLRLSCDVHPWMYAYICVVDNPFFAVTAADGKYAISNVPPGDYVLEAYHVKTHGSHDGEMQRITVTEGEANTANFTIESPTLNGRMAQRR